MGPEIKRGRTHRFTTMICKGSGAVTLQGRPSTNENQPVKAVRHILRRLDQRKRLQKIKHRLPEQLLLMD